MPNAAVWAIHIADGFLATPWLVGGFAAAALLGLAAYLIDYFRAKWQGKELGEQEIALIGVLTAAFYVGSLIRVPVGPSSVHLLLNGLLGVVLGWRAALAIPVGLLFQAALFGHGGFTSLGVNSCVMVLPAIAGWGLFAGLHRLPFLCRPWFRGVLVALSAGVWLLAFVYSVALICSNSLVNLREIDPAWASRVTLHPVTLLAVTVVGLLAARYEPRLENAPEFPLGLLVGTVTVLLTMVLYSLVLVHGGGDPWGGAVLVAFVLHMPVAAVEGVILGFTVGFLMKVKPSLLGLRRRRGGTTPVRGDAEAPVEEPASCGVAAQPNS